MPLPDDLHLLTLLQHYAEERKLEHAVTPPIFQNTGDKAVYASAKVGREYLARRAEVAAEATERLDDGYIKQRRTLLFGVLPDFDGIGVHVARIRKLEAVLLRRNRNRT